MHHNTLPNNTLAHTCTCIHVHVPLSIIIDPYTQLHIHTLYHSIHNHFLNIIGMHKGDMGVCLWCHQDKNIVDNTHMHTYRSIYYTYVYAYTYIHTHTHTHIHTYIHTCTYIHIYTHTHIHTYTHTHTHAHTHIHIQCMCTLKVLIMHHHCLEM